MINIAKTFQPERKMPLVGNPCIIIYVVAPPAIWLVTYKFRNPQRIATLIQV
jgi:hypothetical protein